MNVESERIAPYAPYANVLTVIRHARDRGLKEPVTTQMITTIGVPEGNTTRTLQALRFLKLLDEEGYLTDNFKALSNAPSDEYPNLLAQILKDAYSIVFMALDPATATDQQYVNAFRLYEPKAQRNRMITLFKGLCREAGLIPGGSPEVLTRPRTTTNKNAKSPTSANGARGTSPETKDAPFESESFDASTHPTAQPLTPTATTQEYTILSGMLNKLPFAEKRWTQKQREKWLRAVAATVDLLFELEDPNTEFGMEEDLYQV